MESLRRMIFDVVIFAAAVFTGLYIYQVYGETIRGFFFDETEVVIFLDNLAVEVTIADSPEERELGLSGVASLGELEGKLFIFDKEGQYGIWMKDMLMPIDIIFINDDLEIVEIVENVTPDTFPRTFTSAEPARFVLETNAFFVESFKVKPDAKVSIPPRSLPFDLRTHLRE